MEHDEMMSTSEAAEYLNMGYTLLKYYIKRGDLKAKLVGNRYVVMKKDADEFRNRKK